jgi:hypothetical protein
VKQSISIGSVIFFPKISVFSLVLGSAVSRETRAILWFGLLLFHVKLPITIGRVIFFQKLCFSLLFLADL